MAAVVLFGLIIASGRAFAIEGGKVMTAEKTTMAFGWRVYGLGVMALGMVCLVLGDFHPGQPVPKDFPDRTALAYAAAAFMLIAGTAVVWRRTAAWGRRGAHCLSQQYGRPLAVKRPA